MDFITDRTEADALLGNENGVYNYTDLNRVEQAVAAIAEQFPQLGISLSLETKSDWAPPEGFSVGTWNVESQMARYLENVTKIRGVFSWTIQLPSSMRKLNWQGANNIEKVLHTALERINGIKQSFRYSGEIFAGEEL